VFLHGCPLAVCIGRCHPHVFQAKKPQQQQSISCQGKGTVPPCIQAFKIIISAIMLWLKETSLLLTGGSCNVCITKRRTTGTSVSVHEFV
jgi:hypothetical protein